MMTSSTPMARARSRALGVMGQLKRLLIGSGGTDFEATEYQPPTPSLAAAIAVRSRPVGAYAAGSDPILDKAIACYPRLEAFLQQDMHEHAGFASSLAQLRALLAP